MTKKRIILYGHLKDLYPHPIEVEATTVAEAIRSLEQIPELRPVNGQPHPVTIRGIERESQLFAQSDIEELHVMPDLGGGGGFFKATFRIVIGVAMVGLALYLGPTATLLGGWLSSTTLAMTGAMLALGGIVELLSPKQKVDDSSDNRSSASLGQAANTTRIGTPIGIGYGNYKIGGQYLTFDIDAKDFSGQNNPPDPLFAAGDSVFVEHDKTPTPLVPILPVFSSPVASSSNVPVSGWTP